DLHFAPPLNKLKWAFGSVNKIAKKFLMKLIWIKIKSHLFKAKSKWLKFFQVQPSNHNKLPN
ncbi:hypothetical protein, partial [Mycoplasmoides pneumoniae]|uniref:hypothetical protein n=1 Tax=Mycoplasmoides pneumoniae TaxID=2104 RepID=UPI001F35C647